MCDRLFRVVRGAVHIALIAILISVCWERDGWGGPIEDVLLENKQITVDQWVRLKADEEKREAKAMEQSRSIGDVPVRERWYEKISIRGYTHFRYNFTPDNDLLNNSLGDRSIAGNNEFFMRRARLIVSGQPHDRVFVYLQGEFAGLVANSEGTAVLRDAYADLFLTENKEWRIRAGQSKVPFSFENLQSSQNRLALDRADPVNSAFPTERNLGVFLYYTPTTVRERFRRLVDSGLKGSGDYGMLGIGVFNGQAINQLDANKNKHLVFHSSYPHEFSNGQIVEVGMDAYTGQVGVSTFPVVPTDPTLTGGQNIGPLLTNDGNYLDERVAWHVVVFPQPFGFQAEYNIGRGPQLNEDRTAVELGSLRGGYVQLFYNYKCDTYCQNIFPFVRMQEYFGGRKFEDNAPRYSVRETELGLEYQFNRALELTVSYSWSQRTSGDSATLPITGPNQTCASPASPIGCIQTPYQLQTGNLIRFQLQWSF
ncbi:MAG: OprO/OprP family phosphate-selective porin [Nitrospira sp.]|nr:OprO/OprP family phosphate-selective porin [Nitrospira sp.]